MRTPTPAAIPTTQATILGRGCSDRRLTGEISPRVWTNGSMRLRAWIHPILLRNEHDCRVIIGAADLDHGPVTPSLRNVGRPSGQEEHGTSTRTCEIADDRPQTPGPVEAEHFSHVAGPSSRWIWWTAGPSPRLGNRGAAPAQARADWLCTSRATENRVEIRRSVRRAVLRVIDAEITCHT